MSAAQDQAALTRLGQSALPPRALLNHPQRHDIVANVQPFRQGLLARQARRLPCWVGFVLIYLWYMVLLFVYYTRGEATRLADSFRRSFAGPFQWPAADSSIVQTQSTLTLTRSQRCRNACTPFQPRSRYQLWVSWFVR